MTALIIISTILAAVFFCLSILGLHNAKLDSKLPTEFCLIAFLGCLIVVLLGVIYEFPDEQDVLDGKAVYVETKHITGNDTITTYKIVRKEVE